MRGTILRVPIIRVKGHPQMVTTRDTVLVSSCIRIL